MKITGGFFILCLVAITAPCRSEIKTIQEGGVELNVSDHVARNEAAVIVFHTPWDQTSITLLSDVKDWAGQYPNLTILLVDVVDPRTQVYRQFSLSGIPNLVVLDKDHQSVGSPVDNLSDMESLLKDHGIL